MFVQVHRERDRYSTERNLTFKSTEWRLNGDGKGGFKSHLSHYSFNGHY